MERRAACQLVAFDQEHVPLAQLAEVVGHAGPAHAATDDHYPDGVGQLLVGRHNCP